MQLSLVLFMFLATVFVPSHYERALDLIAAVEQSTCQSSELKVMQTQSSASALSCQFIFKTSSPPKRELTFTLDRIVYRTVVTMRNLAPTLTPVADGS